MSSEARCLMAAAATAAAAAITALRRRVLGCDALGDEMFESGRGLREETGEVTDRGPVRAKNP